MKIPKQVLVSVTIFPKLWNGYRKPFCTQGIHLRNKANSYTSRSHTCGEMTIKHVDQTVKVHGWLQYQRMNQFVVLRDAYGLLQALIPDTRSDIKSILSRTPLESVIEITGKVHKRPPNMINKKMPTGEIEVFIDDFKVLNLAKPLPFTIRDYNKANESTRMKYRYLDLRFPVMQNNLRFRSALLMKMREFLVDHEFVEVETPTLFKKTPGGAQEFIVPTHFPGEFYSLVQSPQQLKQLLMVGGVDRYFQMARCYRDEGARPDRQPEFTQLDIELSFSDADCIMSLIEDLLSHCWPENCGNLSTPFQRLSYKDVMQKFGTDQPGHISEFPIINLLNVGVERFINAIIVKEDNDYIISSLRKQCTKLKEQYFNDTRLHILKYSNNKSWKITKEKYPEGFENKLIENGIEENDFIFLSDGPELNSLKLLGKLRVLYINLLKEEDTSGKWIKDLCRPVWIVDFPLFEAGDQPGQLKSVHHPFTSPHPEDLHLLHDNPLKVRGLHYDLVLNGFEIGGGSVRIHDYELQKNILSDMLKFSDESLKHLLEALASGAPPHAGIALGIDRLVAILVGAHSVRDVIAFPKSSEGRDHLSGAPSPVTQNDLDFYNVKIVPPR